MLQAIKLQNYLSKEMHMFDHLDEYTGQCLISFEHTGRMTAQSDAIIAIHMSKIKEANE